MRIRKIKDKDIYAAAALMQRSGVKIDSEALERRLLHFQRNHTVVVAEQHSRLVSLMHIGIEPSLLSDRKACIYVMFVDARRMEMADASAMLLAYGKKWAQQHGCETLRYDSENIDRDIVLFLESSLQNI